MSPLFSIIVHLYLYHSKISDKNPADSLLLGVINILNIKIYKYKNIPLYNILLLSFTNKCSFLWRSYKLYLNLLQKSTVMILKQSKINIKASIILSTLWKIAPYDHGVITLDGKIPCLGYFTWKTLVELVKLASTIALLFQKWCYI